MFAFVTFKVTFKSIMFVTCAAMIFQFQVNIFMSAQGTWIVETVLTDSASNWGMIFSVMNVSTRLTVSCVAAYFTLVVSDLLDLPYSMGYCNKFTFKGLSLGTWDKSPSEVLAFGHTCLPCGLGHLLW